MSTKVYINRQKVYLRNYYDRIRWAESTGLKLTGNEKRDLVILKKAEKMRYTREIELIENPIKKNNSSFYEFCTTCIKSPLDAASCRLFAKFDQKTSFFNLNLAFFDDFIDFVSKTNYKQSTKKAYISFIFRCIKKAYRAEKIKDDFSQKLNNLKSVDIERNFLTSDEVKKIMQLDARDIKNGEIVKAGFLFSVFTGLRYSDCRTLTENNIKNGVIEKRQVKTKNLLKVPLNENAKDILGSREFGDFVKKYNNKVQTVYVDKILKLIIKKAGINKKISFHCARRTHAYLLLNSGADLYTVKEILGHKKIQTTQIYSNLDPDVKVNAENNLIDRNFF